MSNPKEPLEPGGYYHVFTHAVGRDNFFDSDKNYVYFLEKVDKWILPVADILSYCLMPNHFHFVVRIKEDELLDEFFAPKFKQRRRYGEKDNAKEMSDKRAMISRFITEQFSHCFNSYAQAYNRLNNRSGSLFKESFQRNLVKSSDYLLRLICYVHNNPVNHNFVDKREDWKYSSYNAIITNGKSKIFRDGVMELFGDVERFKYVHDMFLGEEI